MKYFLLIAIFSSHMVLAQDLEKDKIKPSYNPFSLAIGFTPAANNLLVLDDNFMPSSIVINRSPHISGVRTLTAADFNLSTAPVTSFNNLNDVMLGQVVTQPLRIGGIETNTRYVFDMNGNLVDHEFSISIGKKKRKKRK